MPSPDAALERSPHCMLMNLDDFLTKVEHCERHGLT